MQIDILNIEGKKTGRTIELPEEIFGVEPNNHVIYLAVKQYLAAQRQGTHKVKTRAEVQGASRKLHKQKGTGGARKGNIRNPLYKGGGTIFGPKPHGWGFKLNRKVKDLAKISALSVKAKENSIIIVEDLQLETPKTKQFVGFLKNLNINVEGRKTMFITPEYNDNVYLSLRNIPTVDGTVLSDVNTYDIMNSNYIVFTESAAKIFTEEPAEAEA
ncbi:large subunit ribosomal protein L4 [Chitinophaga ginsengisegetis]|jgi:large subunit ribosomal protein L4|uniref:Large ribosomal subunit protein uL4 n=1 Tax=Chitinophaga ginsengisegetis TaxID=393003 RepID=A0A1T5P265_9BACT|nr:50S ribosomal protein L4 [Chitinophaga ginsengisegetis]MDR6566761.1 large subunit ribosomal protein L4 [Chitinophaga ginsengisegetis]MDR6646491.1 large subunit ribosomal protein L4 [Chitinophaga ginsengisegetis]MDR6652841.1 large subunit ribosomal protein L4 [Chitinophaga ginsengisegetis]SKD06653.1 large subunit ribosomal protein L4 [Chitinophaga ginsengisegetis]